MAKSVCAPACASIRSQSECEADLGLEAAVVRSPPEYGVPGTGRLIGRTVTSHFMCFTGSLWFVRFRICREAMTLYLRSTERNPPGGTRLSGTALRKCWPPRW